MNRNVTRKWAEARQVNYAGDDWGDEEDDGYDEPAYPPVSQERRSFTNPQPGNTEHRLSFDRGQEQRVFSASAAHPQQGFLPSQNAPPDNSRFYAQHPTAQHGQTSAPVEPAARPSTDAFRRDAPRPDSRGSNTSARQFPPRKSSLGQAEFPDYARSQPPPETEATRRIVFPADIYKRHAEEERKRSQESSRPSMDSISRAASEGTPKQSIDIDSSRRRQPTLDTVAERRSEYIDNSAPTPVEPTSHASQQHAAQTHIQGINTDTVGRFPSASSRYTDRPDPISASTVESPFPSRNTSQTDPHHDVLAPTSGLPPITRLSTFGSDFFSIDSAGDTRETVRHPNQPPPLPPKDAQQDSLQHRPSDGYRTLVADAFHSENQKLGSPARTDDSMYRTNTTSTSEISPIVGRPDEPLWDRALAENVRRANEPEASQPDQNYEQFTPPRRLGTNRRASPSPARRPFSVEAPHIPEPQSVISMTGHSPGATQDTAREAQLSRPGAAVLIHSRGNSRDSIHDGDANAGQGTSTAELSERSNQRSASEEWADWTAARREAHAKLGIQDSNPATPNPDSSGLSSPAPAFDSLDKNVQSTGSSVRNENLKLPPAISGLPSQRPHVTRDESFRPVLPGGWQSSTSIQRAAAPEPRGLQPQRPGFASSAARNESTESIPTATAPRSTNWRSEYTGIQAQAFAAASAAGDALAGIFNGPSLTSRGGDSEVSSITESDEDHASTRRDPTFITRDFGAATPDSDPPFLSESSATRDFGSSKPETSDVSQVTPKAQQRSFTNSPKPAPLTTSHPQLKRPDTTSVRADSPTKESERWWSDEEEEEAAAPAPLRTSRMSTNEPTRPTMTHSDSDAPDVDQLHSDIVQSLTPKSSSIADASKQGPGRVSPLRQTSPPFSAAALAVSPGRALQEQNAWKPLSAPQSEAASPKDPNPPMLGVKSPEERLTGRGDGQEPPSTQTSRDWFGDLDSRSARVDDPLPPQQHAPLASKSLAAQENVPALPPVTGTTPGADPFKSSPLTASERSAPSPVASQYFSSSAAHGTTTAPDEENRSSDTTPSFDRVPRAPVKDLPKPITAANEVPERSSTPTRSQDLPSPTTPRSTKAAQPPFTFDSSRSFPSDKVPIGQIVNMGSAQQRIRAYNENRDNYTQPVGNLEHWLSFMNTPEHADVFSAKPTSSAMYATPSPRHQQRDSTGAPIGTKQMQEDGKKLLASAGKYGARASVLGKGLFSKGKEKFRTVSAGQKGPSTGRSKTASVPEVSQISSTSHGSAPQLPTPSVATPIDESSLSMYFNSEDANVGGRTAAPRPAADPPFSPISEISTNHMDRNMPLDRTVSAVSEEQSPQSGSTVRPTHSILSPTRTVSVGDKRKSAGAVSSLNADHDQRQGPEGILNRSSMDRSRRHSGVSDVSSVSAPDDRRQSQAGRTISPPLESQFSRHESSLPQRQPTRTASPPTEAQRPQHAPSYSTAMASTSLSQKEAEAAENREQESTLPAYSQSAQPKAPEIGPGAQIVPIARIRPDQELPRAEEQRPFSFLGSESLLNSGHGTNHSIDHPGANTGSPISSPSTDRHGIDQFDRPQLSPGFANAEKNAESPLPSARRNPEEFGGKTQDEFAKLRQQPQPPMQQAQQAGEYRIPGPYGQELRAPKPKTSSPLLQQYMSPVRTTAQPEGDPFYDVPAVPSGDASTAVIAAQQQQQRSQDDVSDPVPAQTQHMPGAFPVSQGPEPERERGRSKLSSFFRSRSKSRSRRAPKEQKDQRTEERPDGGRRNSLFKLGSRGTMRPDQQDEPDYDEITDQTTQATARPGAGSRRLSKDLFKSTTFGQQNQGRADHPQRPPLPNASPAAKKKRFSGFFSKSPAKEEPPLPQPPTRATTLPIDAQQPPTQRRSFHHQATAAEDHESPNQFQQETRYAENQQPSAMRQQRPQTNQTFEGVPSPTRGYYSGQHERPYSQQQGRGHQYSASSNTPYEGPQAAPGATRYQHENKPYQYEHDVSKQRKAFGNWLQAQMQPPQRPDLPRLNTGDQKRIASHFLPASAPAVPNSYIQSRKSMDASYTQPLPQQQFQRLPTLAQAQQQAYRPPSTRANKDISHGSDYRPGQPSISPTAQMPQQRYGQTGSEQSNITPRVAALHTRSRSPKMGRRSSEDLNAEYDALSVPHGHNSVSGLGTFSSKNISPVGGIPRSAEEQEKPWAINLPGGEDEREQNEIDPASATSTKAREMRRTMLERSPINNATPTQAQERPTTVAERFMGHGLPPKQTAGSSPMQQAINAGFVPIGAVPTSPVMRTSSPSVSISKNPSLRGQAPRSATPLSMPLHGESQPKRDLSIQRNDTPISDPRSSFDAAGISREPSQSQNRRSISVGSNHGMSASTTSPPPLPERSANPLPANMPALPKADVAENAALAPTSRPPPPPPSLLPPAPPIATTNGAEISKAPPADVRTVQRSNAKNSEIHEMPGSRPEGYESDEEPMMSATAYPGQEWMPVFERWED
ncbi:hypothetical protein LTR24_007128 [Lithohypha guttulata]|uniref:Uncharacterized protein n=1 Tax=Lithohypha guttulata TaxID=1690604 RepID=A0ABR0K407_9EURO|nr:hypothetical protein LTR24_007128 [Lithohypha guttulata]